MAERPAEKQAQASQALTTHSQGREDTRDFAWPLERSELTADAPLPVRSVPEAVWSLGFRRLLSAAFPRWPLQAHAL